MSGKDRRISPRKDCALPVRFRVLVNEAAAAASAAAGVTESASVVRHAAVPRATLEGEVLNLSERGIFFRSKEPVSLGAALEMFFTLPRELTGRRPEQVRCNARVVHVKHSADSEGVPGFGATVERFEPLEIKNWYH